MGEYIVEEPLDMRTTEEIAEDEQSEIKLRNVFLMNLGLDFDYERAMLTGVKLG